MHQEISEQPLILDRIWNARNELARLARRFARYRRVFFTAFGSSYNAALHGQFLLYRYLGIPSLVATPGFFADAPELSSRDALLMAISQSGEVQEVIQAVKFLKKRGAHTVAVTNEPGSLLAKTCHEVLPLRAGPERSIPATKTFTATLYNLQILTAYWGRKARLFPLARGAERCAAALEAENAVKMLARKLREISSGFILAPDPLKAVAVEGALKLKECAYMMADAFEWREFFHGPVALAGKETPVLLLPDPASPSSTVRVRSRLQKFGVKAFSLPSSGHSLREREADDAAIPLTVQVQLLALHLAVLSGRNPDHPRHLSKVTETKL